jgi:alkanesulfonate monooxygenase SsuD/methylene tetrahydromethanopterin reductase-like flavin-dependent oxidoreductase (luciferase family)
MSKNTVDWAAKHRYPYVMLATELDPTRQSYEYYGERAKEYGYEAQTQHRGYLFKVHVDETEELAEAAARKYIQGPSNPFLEGNQGNVRSEIQNLPGLTSRTQLLPTVSSFAAAASRGRTAEFEKATGQSAAEQKKKQDAMDYLGTFEQQTDKMSIIWGTPDTVIPKVKHVLEYIRPGSVFFWDGDGAMDHDDAMRSLRLFGEEVIPAVREIGKSLDLKSPFEVDPATNKAIPAAT